ncbi:MAG: 4Fe-4S binding protein [Clostridia bacterium]
MTKGPGRIAGMTLKNLFAKPATIDYTKYTDGDMHVEKNYRGRILYDAADCINCGLCMRDCPTGALSIINDGTKEARLMRAELDSGRCIFCCQCVDSCRRGCLSVSQNVDLSVMDKAALRIKL